MNRDEVKYLDNIESIWLKKKEWISPWGVSFSPYVRRLKEDKLIGYKEPNADDLMDSWHIHIFKDYYSQRLKWQLTCRNPNFSLEDLSQINKLERGHEDNKYGFLDNDTIDNYIEKFDLNLKVCMISWTNYIYNKDFEIMKGIGKRLSRTGTLRNRLVFEDKPEPRPTPVDLSTIMLDDFHPIEGHLRGGAGTRRKGSRKRSTRRSSRRRNTPRRNTRRSSRRRNTPRRNTRGSSRRRNTPRRNTRGSSRRSSRRRNTPRRNTRRSSRRRNIPRKSGRRRVKGSLKKDNRKGLVKCPPIKKSSENEKTINDTVKIKDKEVNVFVINLKKHADRWKKYKGNSNYKRFPAVIGADLPADNEYLKGKMIMMWNAGDKQRRNVVGCYLSHLNLLKKIVKQKLNKTIILEDDCQIDTKELNKINLDKLPQDKMIYFGGTLRSMTFKTKGWDINRVRKTLLCDKKKSTLNKIVPGKFKIGGAHCYYYPTWKSAENIIKYLESKKRVRAIDSEHAIIQKSNPELLDSFMYPALGYLVLEQAQKGFSGQYGFDRNMKYY